MGHLNQYVKAQLLLEQIQKLMSMQGQVLSQKLTELVNYKFYTELIYQQFQHTRQWGIDPRSFLLAMRRALAKEVEMERKLAQEQKSALMQFVLIFILGQAFIIFAGMLLQIELSWQFQLLPALWQILGMLCFFIVLKQYQKYFFGDISFFAKNIYQFVSAIKAALALGAITSSLDWEQQDIKQDLMFIKQRLENMVQYRLKQGELEEAELDMLTEDFWMALTARVQQFEIKVTVIKFMHLAVFSLPAYLAMILGLVSALSWE